MGGQSSKPAVQDVGAAVPPGADSTLKPEIKGIKRRPSKECLGAMFGVQDAGAAGEAYFPPEANSTLHKEPPTLLKEPAIEPEIKVIKRKPSNECLGAMFGVQDAGAAGEATSKPEIKRRPSKECLGAMFGVQDAGVARDTYLPRGADPALLKEHPTLVKDPVIKPEIKAIKRRPSKECLGAMFGVQDAGAAVPPHGGA